MKKLTSLLPTMVLVFLVSTGLPEAADSQALSPIELKTKSIVDAAYDLIMEHSDNMSYVQKELQTNPKYFDHDKGLYIFVHCYHEGKDEAVCCGQGARPELVGKNMWHLRTPNGRLLFHELKSMMEKNGKGWLEYDWLNPFTRTIQTKRSYAREIILSNGRKGWVGSGYWVD